MSNIITFFSEKIKFSYPDQKALEKWILDSIHEESYTLKELSIIFTNDNYLLDINKKYLKHDYYTDIITFNYVENKILSGDIFISIERVEENARIFKTTFIHELNRIIIHGVLHLLDYDDDNAENKKIMTEKENYYLLKINNSSSYIFF